MALHASLRGLLLLLMMTSISAGSDEMNATCDASDLAALRSFVVEIFPEAYMLVWGEVTADNCCAWPGYTVTCSESRRVTELTVQYNIQGSPIPPSVCSLSALTSLTLSGGITGSILPCIGSNLTNLVHLDLSSNSLSGSIPPSFSHLRALLSLDLHDNLLSGPLLLSSLPSSGRLNDLDLSANSLSGVLNTGLSFANLSSLALANNAFSGPIPSFNITPPLVNLDLSSNFFSGSLSSLFGSLLPSLTNLDLSSNSLSGEIPSFDPSHLPSIDSLSLADNLLNGSLPHSLCRLGNNLWSLSLSSNAFSGQLLPQCKEPHLTRLAKLDVSYNQFVGAFPEWIGSLLSLEELDLSYNRFNGSLPNSWRSLPYLTALHLSGNSLVPGNDPGAFMLPRWLFTFPSMSALSLSSMRLKDTDLDCYSDMLLFNASRDVDLDISDNSFTSGVLGCLSQYMSSSFVSLRGLNLSGNPLSLNLGHAEAVKLIPTSLYSLDLSSCQIRGSLTHLFFDRITPSVNFLSLAHNHLAGVVPAQLGNFSNLIALDLSHNVFTGFAPIPPERKLGTLHYISISHNKLAGNLSTLLLNVLNVSRCYAESYALRLLSLDLSNNVLEGSIPSFLGHCIAPSVTRLKLNDNHLEGFLPSELFDINTPSRLQVLSLSNNRFTGKIPSSFRHLTELLLLDLGHNRLQGSLERVSLFSNASESQYSKLRVLLLGYNEFTGSVPLSLGQIAPALQLIDLSNNHLTGPIPVSTLQAMRAFRVGNTLDIPGVNISLRGTLHEELRLSMKGSDVIYEYVLAALTSLDVSGNELSGPIPAEMGELGGLVVANLSRNALSGKIPSEIGKLAEQLQVLDVAFNELVGPIPASFGNLTKLAVFNVSYNKGLRGPIPQSQPQFEMAESYIGDPDLCGEPTLHSCSIIVPGTTPAASSQSNNNVVHEEASPFARWRDEWIAIPGLCLGLLVGFFTTLLAVYYGHLKL